MASHQHERPFQIRVTDGPAIQVEVGSQRYRAYDAPDRPDVICLTIDTKSLAQFHKDVDELIAELTSLKAEAAQLLRRRSGGR